MFGKRLDVLLAKYRLSIPEGARREWIELMRHLAAEEAQASVHQGIAYKPSIDMSSFSPVDIEAPLHLPSMQNIPVSTALETQHSSTPHTTIIESSPRKKNASPPVPLVFAKHSVSQEVLDAWNQSHSEATHVNGLPQLPPLPTESHEYPVHSESSVHMDVVMDSQHPLSSRYEDLGLIAQGGMGEVRRVKDRELNRVMAMKVLRSKWLNHPEVMIRFLEEAQTTAQLQHPGVVPVHELGYLPDGRIYFTMKEIRGRTLSEEIRVFHSMLKDKGSDTVHFKEDEHFKALIEAFAQVCEAVGWAHSRGVVHRDLKPENIMLSQLDEVLVIDWGLARIADRRDALSSLLPKQDEILTHRSHSESSAWNTHLGEVIGTPAYMPPEQARGEHDQLGPTADVYALGAILYEILSGRPPYDGETFARILYKVLEGPPPPPTPHPPTSKQFQEQTGFHVPETPKAMRIPSQNSIPVTRLDSHDQWESPIALLNICERSMARLPKERYASATELAQDVRLWLQQQAQTHPHASPRDSVHEARRLLESIYQYKKQEALLRRQAKESLQSVQGHQPESRKEYGWSLEEEARLIFNKVHCTEWKALHTLQSILQEQPQHREARALFLHYCQTQHQRAEHNQDLQRVFHYESLLRNYDPQAWVAYSHAPVLFQLETDPVHVQVTWFSYKQERRKWVLQKEKSLGTTPLQGVQLPPGRHVLKLESPTTDTVYFPIYLERSKSWYNQHPEAFKPSILQLPKASTIDTNETYIPAGSCWIGGDSEAPHSLHKQETWIDSFIIQTKPVTHAQYLEFLNDLLLKDQIEEALRFAPRNPEHPDTILYEKNEQGRLTLRKEGQHVDAQHWYLNTPVTWIDWSCAQAWTEWYAKRTQKPWRLPSELEWEKAARGVDGRFFPWGNWLDPTWCCMQQSHSTSPRICSVHSHPLDSSPYGVKGMAGNIREWCADTWQPHGPEFQHKSYSIHTQSLFSDPSSETEFVATRGGSWMDSAAFCRAAARRREKPSSRLPTLGFRVVYTPGDTE